MDWYTVSVLLFVAVLAVLVYRDRHKFKRESIFLLRKTKRGRDLIIRVGTRFPLGWKVLGFISVVTGLVVSVLGLKMLFDNMMSSISAGSAAPSLALILPSPTAEPIFGYGFLAIPFWYWIICLALLAVVHEGLHGIFSAREGVRIKSLGVGILAVIPLAFVEPDERQLAKKGVWPQLRVFSAGSFANFLLAALTLLIILWVSNAIFIASGVDFGYVEISPYPVVQIELNEVTGIGGNPVNGTGEMEGALESFGENDTVEITTANGTFFLRKWLFTEQLNESPASIVVFDDYPAARAGLEGTIIRIGGHEITDSLDLSLSMEDIGPGRNISIVTKVKGEEHEYALTTVEKPPTPAYTPDSLIYIFAALEHLVPGSVESYYSAGEAWAGMTGQRTGVTWNYIQFRISLWEWVSENYPLLQSRAEQQEGYWSGMLDSHQSPGFIGITGVVTHFDLKAGMQPYKQSLEFIQGLLFFMFLINLGVGIVNLLPVKPLDGGRMWDIILKRYVPKHGGEIMRAVGVFTLILLLANFIPFGTFL